MKKWFKRLMSLVLALVLVFGLMPSRSFADTPPDSGGAGRTDWTNAQYQVEWLPHKNDDGYFDGIEMHLRKDLDYYGPECRSLEYDENTGGLVNKIRSVHASYSQMRPDLGGDTLDSLLTFAQNKGYNGDERRNNDLDFSNGDNDCYAQWTHDVEDGKAGDWAIYINLHKKPQGTWGYFCDTNDSGGHDNPPDKTELDIPAGETRVLTDGYWQAHWEKRGDWSSYVERDDIGDTNWAAEKVGGTPITSENQLASEFWTPGRGSL